jgi:hypothetical protein
VTADQERSQESKLREVLDERWNAAVEAAASLVEELQTRKQVPVQDYPTLIRAMKTDG